MPRPVRLKTQRPYLIEFKDLAFYTVYTYLVMAENEHLAAHKAIEWHNTNLDGTNIDMTSLRVRKHIKDVDPGILMFTAGTGHWGVRGFAASKAL